MPAADSPADRDERVNWMLTNKALEAIYAEALSTETVASVVRHINAIAADPESAHDDEDRLYQEVLKAVASGHPDAAQLAAVALETKQIDFPRWKA